MIQFCSSWTPLDEMIADYFDQGQAESVLVRSDIGGVEYLTGDLLFRKDGITHIENYASELCKGKVLDIGAGAGALSLILSKSGFEVYPVEVCTKAVQVMKNRGLSSARNINFWDIQNEKYDTLFLMMNGIGFVGSIKQLHEFFEKAKNIIAEGGQILLDSSNIKHQLIQANREEIYETEPGEVTYSLKYKNFQGRPYKWLFIEFESLRVLALKYGLIAQKIFEENDQYLARIVIK